MSVLRLFAPPSYLRRAGGRVGRVQMRNAAATLNLTTAGLWVVREITGWPHARPPLLAPPAAFVAASVGAVVLVALSFAALNVLGWLATSPTTTGDA